MKIQNDSLLNSSKWRKDLLGWNKLKFAQIEDSFLNSKHIKHQATYPLSLQNITLICALCYFKDFKLSPHKYHLKTITPSFYPHLGQGSDWS